MHVIRCVRLQYASQCPLTLLVNISLKFSGENYGYKLSYRVLFTLLLKEATVAPNLTDKRKLAQRLTLSGQKRDLQLVFAGYFVTFTKI